MTIKGAGLVIFRRKPDVEYLFLQSSFGQNQWSPPKGHVDDGENEYTAAIRETEEETTLNAEDLKIRNEIVGQVEYINRKGFPKIVTYWLAEMVRDKDIKLSFEHQDYKWLGFEEACKLSEYQNLPSVLSECHKLISQAE